MREALVRMRADEACIQQMNAIFADLSPGDRCAGAEGGGLLAGGWVGRVASSSR